MSPKKSAVVSQLAGLFVISLAPGVYGQVENRTMLRARYDASNKVVCVGAEEKAMSRVLLPKAKTELAAAGSESIVVASGGRDKMGFLTSDTYLILPSGQIKEGKTMPSARCRHAMARVDDGTLLVVGGVVNDSDGALALAKDVLSYSITKDTWEHITDLPKRSAQCVAEVVDGKLFVIAGDTGTATETGYPIAPARCRADVQIFDLKTHEWSSGTPKPTPETGVTSAVRDGEIFVVSSETQDGKVAGTMEVYNTKTDKWRRIPDMPTPRTKVACGFIDGKLYCVNGLGSDLTALSLVEVFDPETNRWLKEKEAPPPSYASGYLSHGSTLLLLGGRK